MTFTATRLAASIALAAAAVALLPAARAQEVKGPAGADGKPVYVVVDGTKVDERTMRGYRAWRNGACDRCHGVNQEGMVGPSLIEAMKKMDHDAFVKTVREGRLDQGMQSFATNKTVMDNIDGLYGYLKGRSDGAITSPQVEAR